VARSADQVRVHGWLDDPHQRLEGSAIQHAGKPLQDRHFAYLLQVFDNMKSKKSNLFYSPYGAKLYNAMGPIYHTAAAKEKTPEQAVQALYDEFVRSAAETSAQLTSRLTF